MTDEPKRYEIRTVRDLLAVPIEKLDDCLADLAAWVVIIKASEEMPQELRVRDIPGACSSDRFVWIDDGEHIARLYFPVPVEGESR